MITLEPEMEETSSQGTFEIPVMHGLEGNDLNKKQQARSLGIPLQQRKKGKGNHSTCLCIVRELSYAEVC